MTGQRLKGRLHWFCHLLTPYNNFLFTELAKAEGVDLLVHFRRLRRSSHPWQAVPDAGFPWSCPRFFLGVDVHGLRLALAEKDSLFVIGGWSGPWMTSLILARIARGFPFVVWADCPAPRGQRLLWKEAARNCWLRLLFSRAEKILITGTPGLALLREMGCPPQKVGMFPFWVPIPPPPAMPEWPRSGRNPEDPVSFFALGRLTAAKRYDLVISAMQILLKGPGADCAKLTIAGDGSERDRLQNLIHRSGLERSVKLLGWQEHENAMRLLAEADVFVHPADWEPYGVVILEAMARAKPVIASRTTIAAADRVTPGVNGFLFRRGDAQDLAGYMRRFISERTLIHSMGQQARLVAESWPITRVIASLKQVFGNG